MTWRPLRVVAVVAFAAVAVLSAACGAASPTRAAPWRAGHPDQPPGCAAGGGTGVGTPAQQCVTFSDAMGLCAVSVRYPDEAPGLITVEGQPYLQHERRSRDAATQGTQVAVAGDWRLLMTGATLELLTPSAVFVYEPSSGC